jgi:periplasmic protein TonB
MLHSVLHNDEMNEIIFENRNKAYGAYALRHDYERTMAKAMASGMLFFLCCISSPYAFHYFSSRMNQPEEILLHNVAVNLEDFKKEFPKPPAIMPKQTPPPSKNQIKYIAPAVLPDKADVDEQLQPTVDQLKENNPGTTTTNTPDGAIDPGILEVSVAIPGEPVLPVEPAVYNSFAVEQQPEFPDGMAALYKFLNDHLRFPQIAIDNGISGVVYVSFVVSKEGIIRDAKVIKGAGGGLDQEALRVIRLMPAWKPGRHNGKAVAVNFTLPIKFQLVK